MVGKTFYYDLDILERHLDTFGHVNNAKYLEIFEEARWDLVTHNGYGLEEVRSSGKGPIVLQVNLRFKKELRLREKVRVQTSVVSHNKKLSMFRQAMLNPAGEVCAEADFTMGFFDTVVRKLISPTPKWLAALGVANIGA